MSKQRLPDEFADSSSSDRLKALLRHRMIWPALGLALILVVDGFVSPGFFTIRIVEGRLFGSLIDILYRAMPTATVALGMAVVIGTKGIDLSVGSIIAICGAVIAWRIHAGDPHVIILLLALATGLLCGLWNGLLVALLDIQPIIATLILMVSGRGIGLMINLIYGGTNPSFTSPLLQGLSVGHIGLIPTRSDRFCRNFPAALAAGSPNRVRSVSGSGRRECAGSKASGRQRSHDHLLRLSDIRGLRRSRRGHPHR